MPTVEAKCITSSALELRPPKGNSPVNNGSGANESVEWLKNRLIELDCPPRTNEILRVNQANIKAITKERFSISGKCLQKSVWCSRT